MLDLTVSPTLKVWTNQGEKILAKQSGAENKWTSNDITMQVKFVKKKNLLILVPVINTETDINIEKIEIINILLNEKDIRYLRFGLNMPGDAVFFGRLNSHSCGKKFIPAYEFCRSETEHEIIIENNHLVAVSDRDRKKIFVIGNGTFNVAEGNIFLIFDKQSEQIRLSYQFNLDGIKMAAGMVKELDTIIFSRGNNLNKLLKRWTDYTAKENQALVPTKIPTGWNDWQFYRNEKTQEHVLDSAEVIAKLKTQGFPLEFVQVDGGFCMYLSEWSKPKKEFAMGLTALSNRISKMGLKFGLWLAPYIQNRETNVVKEHPEWLMLDENGQPLELPRSNVGCACLIDYSLDEPLLWLREVVRMFVNEWNVKWIKLDGPNYAYYRNGKLRNKTMTMTEMLTRTFNVIREEAGPKVLVEGEGMMGIALGNVDLHRVQGDNHPMWYNGNDSLNPNAMRNYGKELIMAFMHNRWWCNHRENVILRDYPSCFFAGKETNPTAVEQIFSEAEFQSQLVAVVMSPGGLLLTDPMKDLKRLPYRMKYISKLLPVWSGAAEIVDVFPDHDCPSSYLLKVETDSEKYYLLGIINWGDEVKDFQFKLPDLLGDKEKNTYYAYSFFDEKLIGEIKNILVLQGVTAHGCKLVALREKKKHPQLVSTSMHLLQGAVELKKNQWKKKSRCLKLNIDHFTQKDEKLYLAKPNGWKLDRIETNAERCVYDDYNSKYPVIRFKGNKSNCTEFKIFWKIK